jgi:outer membrane protein assembly factor BamA
MPDFKKLKSALLMIVSAGKAGIFWGTVFLFCALSAPAAAENPEPVIRSFRVLGLTRTHLSVIEPYYIPYIGKPYSESFREEIIQNLRSLGIFHSIEIFGEPADGVAQDGFDAPVVDATILIEEKWTLLPIPFAGARNDGSAYGGLAVLESNFLGYNKKIYGGGIFSLSGWQGIFGYSDPWFFSPDFSFSFMFTGGINERKLVTERDTVYQDYRTTDFIIRSGLFRKVTDSLTLGAAAGFLDRSVDKDFGSRPTAPPDSVRFISGGFSFQYQDLFYDRILIYGFTLQTQYLFNFSALEDIKSYNEYDLTARYQKAVWDRCRLNFSVLGIYIPGAPLVQERSAGGKIFKTLPNGLIADAAVQGQASLEFAAVDFSSGVVTLLGSYEAGVFSLDESSPSYTHGPGVGLRVYLSKIAIPAFGVDIYYNVKTGKSYFSINAGVSF